MVALIIGMLICVGLALAVVALVAIPARRQGRDILTPKGEEVVIALKERQQSARQRLERDDEAAPAEGGPAAEARPVDGAPDAPAVHADAGARS
ncbi:hypothetical protein [Knoellia sp. LjRoot47]|uniref:hypothetical protein n=1 Tax=Knoellia sp. LjRoot47 TaxID=3342330 RepID=UPI003ECCBED9